MFRSLRRVALLGAMTLVGALWSTDASAQVTTGSIRGFVTDSVGSPLEGARVSATHVPSGTVYQATTRADGRFNLPGMRVGGPYTVAATRIGFARQSRDGLTVQLGVSYWLYARAIKHVTALETVLIPVIEPILNPLWVLLATGEKPSRLALVGGLIVLTAVTLRAVATVRARRAAAPATLPVHPA